MTHHHHPIPLTRQLMIALLRENDSPHANANVKSSKNHYKGKRRTEPADVTGKAGTSCDRNSPILASFTSACQSDSQHFLHFFCASSLDQSVNFGSLVSVFVRFTDTILFNQLSPPIASSLIPLQVFRQ